MKLALFIIAVTKSADVGGLFIGTTFGKHPLLPKVSPNKSVEGTLGGIMLSGIVAILMQSFLPPVFQVTAVKLQSALPAGMLSLPSWYIFCIGLFFGSLGQLGDLSESMIKRDCKVKDSGKFLPGTGGVLDMIDSLLFSVPAFFLYVSSTLYPFVKT